MMKRTVAILLAFLSAKTMCESPCPLTTSGEEIVQSKNLTQLNGTWAEHKKSKDFLTEETCITYNLDCANSTACTVDLVQNENKTISTTTLIKNDTGTVLETEGIVYINVDEKGQYVLVWTCDGEANKTYQLAALVVDTSNEIAKRVEDIITKINVNYKNEPKLIDYTGCNSVANLTINLVIFSFALLNSILNI